MIATWVQLHIFRSIAFKGSFFLETMNSCCYEQIPSSLKVLSSQVSCRLERRIKDDNKHNENEEMNTCNEKMAKILDYGQEKFTKSPCQSILQQ